LAAVGTAVSEAPSFAQGSPALALLTLVSSIPALVALALVALALLTPALLTPALLTPALLTPALLTPGSAEVSAVAAADSSSGRQ